MDLNKLFNRSNNGSTTAIVDNIEIYISRSYEKYKMLNISDSVSALAVFEINYGAESKGFFLPAVIEMHPSEIAFETINGTDFVKCTFNKGDIFMKSAEVVQNPNIAYTIFAEYIDSARVPNFMHYENLAFLFDTVKRITGSSIPAEHAAFEMIYAYLSRDPKNFRTMYRLTNMSEPPKYYKLKDVAHVASSTSSKLISAYLKDSLASSMVNASDNTSDLEELLRH